MKADRRVHIPYYHRPTLWAWEKQPMHKKVKRTIETIMPSLIVGGLIASAILAIGW